MDQRYDRTLLSLAYPSSRYTLYREMIASLVLGDIKRNNGEFPKENAFIEKE
jgi:hypothetical protein